MSATNGIYAITSMSAWHPATPLGNEVDIEVGWIEFDRQIYFADNPLEKHLVIESHYQITASGLILFHADGILNGEKFCTAVRKAHELKGTVVKMSRW